MATLISLSLNMQGKEVAVLHSNLSKLGYEISSSELDAQVFGPETLQIVKKLQEKYKLEPTGVYDEALKNAMSAAVKLAQPKKLLVEGSIFFDNGLPASKLTLKFYTHTFGGSTSEIGKAVTDANGFYTLVTNPISNIEVRSEGLKEVVLCQPKYIVDLHEVLNLVAPTTIQQRGSEFSRLTQDVYKQLKSISSNGHLKDAQENDKTQDLAFLHRTTGWDARLLALAAIAEKLNLETNIRTEALYALFRTGLPTSKQELASVNPQVIQEALKKSNEAAITNVDITKAVVEFTNFVQAEQWSNKLPNTVSTPQELLNAVGLSSQEAKVFKDLYIKHQDQEGTVTLWEAAKSSGISEASIKKLQQQGKLAYLTSNNVPLVNILTQEIQSNNELASVDQLLIEKEYFKPAAWKAQLQALSDSGQKDTIPPMYEGNDVASKIEAYAQDMARLVRLSYPNQVIRKMITIKELPVAGNNAALNQAVGKLLANIEELNKTTPKKFIIGSTPLNPLLREYEKELLKGIGSQFSTDKGKTALMNEVKKLQRLYKITPTHEALQVMYRLNFNSAQEVTEYTREEFLQKYAHEFPSQEEAEKVYDKSSQTDAVIKSFICMAQQTDTALSIYGTSPTSKKKKEIQANLIKQYPTLETLFGSVDFCECEHCKSVLSPAAYLVDLLRFIDPTTDENSTEKKPYDVLVERRPDIEHISLTCENTHTALPYIDVVNEILEYYIAHGALDEKAAQDTGDATTEELLAEPQYIQPAAYDKLNEAVYPLNLPFDLWLETARRVVAKFDTALWQVAEVFRKTDELLPPPTTDIPYGRTAILMEVLNISPAKYESFTTSESNQWQHEKKQWYKLYGFETEISAITEAYDTNGQRIDLNSAKALSRRLGVTYKELVTLVSTQFINPYLQVLAILSKWGIGVQAFLSYKNHPNFPVLPVAERAALQTKLDTIKKEYKDTGFNTARWLDTIYDNGVFNKLVALKDSEEGCDFDKTILQYADATPTDGLVLHKLNLFVRLWRKLGWTMQETDQVLQTLWPADLPQAFGSLDIQPTSLGGLGECFKTVLIGLAHLQLLESKLSLGKNAKQSLFALWADMRTTSKDALYQQLFLKSSILKNNPIFDDSLGNYLQYFNTDTKTYEPFIWTGQADEKEDRVQGHVPLNSYLLAVQGALQLTVEEITHILSANKKELDKTALDIATLSLLYRHKLLAKALKLSIKELLTLKELSGIDPFQPIKDKEEESTTIDNNARMYDVTAKTLLFVETVERIKSSGLTVEDLDYIIRHQFDPKGTYRQDPSKPKEIVDIITAETKRLQTEYPITGASLTNEKLKQMLSLVLVDPQMGDQAFQLWSGNITYRAKPVDNAAANQSNPVDLQGEPRISVQYNQIGEKQALSYTGVLTEAEKDRLTDKFAGIALAKELLADVYDQIWSGTHLISKDDIEEAAKLNPDDFQEETKISVHYDAVEKKQGLSYTGVLTQAELERLTIKFADNALAKELLTDVYNQIWSGMHTVTKDGIAEDAKLNSRDFQAESKINIQYDQYQQIQSLTYTGMLTQLELERLKAKFTASELVKELFTNIYDQTWVSQATYEATQNDVADTDKLIPANFKDEPQISVQYDEINKRQTLTYTGVLLYSELERLKASFAASELTQVLLTDIYNQSKYKPIQHLALLILKTDEEADRFQALFELVGTETERREALAQVLAPYLCKQFITQFTIDTLVAYLGIEQNLLELLIPSEELGQFIQYAQVKDIEATNKKLIRLSKVLLILHKLSILLSEVQYMVNHPTVFDGLDLHQIPDEAQPDEEADEEKTYPLFQQLLRLIGYSQLKQEMAGGEDDLIDVFEKASDPAASVQHIAEAIAAITRRNDPTLIKDLADSLGYQGAIAFTDERNIFRLWEAMKLVTKLGIPVTTIQQVTTLIGNGTDRAKVAEHMKNAVKARFEPDAWRSVAQSVFDQLRKMQRDALVAHIMHIKNFASQEQLFEYFLLDTGMEPVVQTSRIRLAITSVQLFIQRCLLNLEPKVNPSAIRSAHWEWMKRYRVWEANRKIFLYPENWLEPEFRDDKTHLFQELESTLLQGDVSKDLVEQAFYTYLKNLETLARLEIVTIHQEPVPNSTSSILHVLGRTYGKPHEYFYRRYANSMWTPWEPVNAKIEGDHIAMIKWQDRIHLFWVSFLEKAETATNNEKISASADKTPTEVLKKQIEVQLNWSDYYQGKWSNAASSGFNKTMVIDNVGADFDIDTVYIHAAVDEKNEQVLKIHLSAPIRKAFHLTNKVSSPESSNYLFPANPPYVLDYLTSNYQQIERNYVQLGAQDAKLVEQGVVSNVVKEKNYSKLSARETAYYSYEEGNMWLVGTKHQLLVQDTVSEKTALILSMNEKFSLVVNNTPPAPNIIGRPSYLDASYFSPFFLQNSQHTFLVEPSWGTVPLGVYEGWGVKPAKHQISEEALRNLLDRLESVWMINPVFPGGPGPISNGLLDTRANIAPEAVFELKVGQDWVTKTDNVLTYEGQLVGNAGKVKLTALETGNIAMVRG